MSTAHLATGFENESIIQISQAIMTGDLDRFKTLTISPNDAFLHTPFGQGYQTALERSIYARDENILKYLLFEVGVDTCHPLIPTYNLKMLNALQLAKRNLNIFEKSPSLAFDKPRQKALSHIIELLYEATQKQYDEDTIAHAQARFIWADKVQPTENITPHKALPSDETGARFQFVSVLLSAALRAYEYKKTRRLFRRSINSSRMAYMRALRGLIAYYSDPLRLHPHAANVLVGAIIIARDSVDEIHANTALRYSKHSTFVEVLAQLLFRLGVQAHDDKTFKKCFYHHFGPMPEEELFL